MIRLYRHWRLRAWRRILEASTLELTVKQKHQGPQSVWLIGPELRVEQAKAKVARLEALLSLPSARTISSP